MELAGQPACPATAPPVQEARPAECRHEHARAIAGGLARRCPTCYAITPEHFSRKQVTECPASPAVAFVPGGILRGKYRLVRALRVTPACGTYLAAHRLVNQPCVVRFVSRSVAGDPVWASEAVRAARLAYRVNDPHIVRLLEADAADGRVYLVTEFVDGLDLATLVHAGEALGWRQAVHVAQDAAHGLEAIHRAGLTHGRIRPSNLLLGIDGRTRVSGLAPALIAAGEWRSGGAACCGFEDVALYDAPERFEARAARAPARDLYALGATIFHLVTGRPPHAGPSAFSRLLQARSASISWPDGADDRPPPWFTDAITQLLAPDPSARFASASEFASALAAGGDESRSRRTVISAEILHPRGFGVLTLRNELGPGPADWIGHAIARRIARGLSEIPGLYVTDTESMSGVLERLTPPHEGLDDHRVLAAARMCGAGTLLIGRYRLEGHHLVVCVDLLRDGQVGRESVGELAGTIESLGDIEETIVQRVASMLGLTRSAMTEAAQSESGAPEARERMVRARQAFVRGDYAEAAALAEQAGQLDPDFAEPVGFAGACYARMGRYAEAESCHRRQEAIALGRRDERMRMEVLANLGVMYYFRGNYDEAQSHYERAAELARHLGTSVELAQISNNLGFVLMRRGLLAEAERAFRLAVDTHRAYGAQTSLVGPYNGMGNVLVDQRRFAEARTHYRRALAIAAELGDRTTVGTTQMHLGRCAMLEGRIEDAKSAFAVALNALEETRFWNGLARLYEFIVELNLQLGDLDEAVRCAERRIELARQHENARMEAAAWRQKADVLRRAGRVDEADDCLRRAEAGSSGGNGANS